MNTLKKKLLILGGKPIGSCEIVQYAKAHDIYTIVTDYLPTDKSPAKQIADETWNISTAEVEKLSKLIIENHIDGVYSGVHEFNIAKMIQVCERAKLPCFCTLEQWDRLINKRSFKNLCKLHDIPVAKEYKITNVDDISITNIEYPVIIKPADGSGSRGFNICLNSEDLKKAFVIAANVSHTGQVLIEEKMDFHNSVIINYTIMDEKVIFSGISDKYSEKAFADGAPIMAVQFYPSLYQKEYLESIDDKAKKMFSDMRLRNGVIWIEAFYKDGVFTFNEMGYRFGGSLTYYPVERVYGIQQLGAQIEYALTGNYSKNYITNKKYEKVYTIMPVHVKPGIISGIYGLDELKGREEFLYYVPVHYIGDHIENWGSAQQVFAYLHFETENREKSEIFANYVMETLSVKDEHGEELLFNLYR